jgi:ACS family hexuronate transporter-like MFS transporter
VILLVLWKVMYRKPEAHPWLSPQELAYITSDGDGEVDSKKVSWFRLLLYRQTWAFAAGKFCTDMVWFFYLSFLPDFFNKSGKFSLDLKALSLPFIIIFLTSDAGTIFFGWFSSKLVSRSWSNNAARKNYNAFLCPVCSSGFLCQHDQKPSFSGSPDCLGRRTSRMEHKSIFNRN